MRTLRRLVMICAAASLVAIAPSNAETIQYSYDALGRVIQIVFSNGKTITYTYDAAGNRITVVTSN